MRTSLKAAVAGMVGVATLTMGAGLAGAAPADTGGAAATATPGAKPKLDCAQRDTILGRLNEKKEYATERLTTLQGKLAAATDDAKKAKIQTRIDKVTAKIAKIDAHIAKVQEKCPA